MSHVETKEGMSFMLLAVTNFVSLRPLFCSFIPLPRHCIAGRGYRRQDIAVDRDLRLA